MDLFELDPQPIASLPYGAAWDFQSARAIQVAVKIKLFTTLQAKPLSAPDLANALGIDPIMTERLLIVLSSLELVLYDQDVWRNRLAAQLYLVADSPLYQGHAIQGAADLWDFYTELETLMYRGESESFWETLRAKRAKTQTQAYHSMVRAMHELALAGQAQHLVRVATSMTGRRRLLDVGAGPGTFSIAFCQRHPSLTAVLWDQPETLNIAQQVITEFNLDHRIRFHPGTWDDTTFDYPESYDAALLSNVIYGADSMTTMTLLKAYDVLEPGGLLVVQDFMLENDLCGPLPAALLNLRRPVLTIEQMLAVIQETGFESVTLLSPGTNQRNAIVMGLKPHDQPNQILIEAEQALPELELPQEAALPGSLLPSSDVVKYTNWKA